MPALRPTKAGSSRFRSRYSSCFVATIGHRPRNCTGPATPASLYTAPSARPCSLVASRRTRFKCAMVSSRSASLALGDLRRRRPVGDRPGWNQSRARRELAGPPAGKQMGRVARHAATPSRGATGGGAGDGDEDKHAARGTAQVAWSARCASTAAKATRAWRRCSSWATPDGDRNRRCHDDHGGPVHSGVLASIIRHRLRSYS